jgi:predicted enzyme related to lactoylglutathione lyase
MGRPVVHFEVMGKDADALRLFYAELFDWKIDANNDLNYGMVSPDDNPAGGAGTSGIGGGIGQMPEGMGPGYATFYVDVDDVEAALQSAERLGGSRVMGPMDVMEGLVIGMFTDPEGHLIGLAASTPAG